MSSEYKHWCENCQIGIYVQRHEGKRLTWQDCPYTCEYATAMRCSTEAKGERVMDDLIHRQAAIDTLEERLKANGYSNAALASELNRSIGYLKRLPSAERHGLWKPVQYGCVCSVCGKRKEQFSDNFCANCGAKMDEVERNEN